MYLSFLCCVSLCSGLANRVVQTRIRSNHFATYGSTATQHPSTYVFPTTNEAACTTLPTQNALVSSANYTSTLHLCVIHATLSTLSLTVQQNVVEVEESVPIHPHSKPWSSNIFWQANIGFRDSDFPHAWQIVQGLKDTIPVIAVFDSGMEASHPDLFYTNASGSHSVLSADSRNFVVGSTCGLCDNTGHGTSVSGVIGSAPNSMFSIAGTSWTGLEIIMLKVMDLDGQSASVVMAIDYLLRTRPDVQLSLHAYGASGLPSHLATAFARLADNNHLAISSAGNDARELGTAFSMFPCCISSVFCVSNYDVVHGSLSSSSNHGSCVSAAAPGFSWTPKLITQGLGVRAMDSTSVAAAFAAGTALLVQNAGPHRNGTSIRWALEQSTRGNRRLRGLVRTEGVINAYGALFRGLEPCPASCANSSTPWMCQTRQCVEIPSLCRSVGSFVLGLCPAVHTCSSWALIPGNCPVGMVGSDVNTDKLCGTSEFPCNKRHCCKGCEPYDGGQDEMLCADSSTCISQFDAVCCEKRSRCSRNYPYMCANSSRFSAPEAFGGISRSGDAGRCQLHWEDCDDGGGIISECPTACATPNVTGYNVVELSSDLLSFNVSVTCATGYLPNGFPRAIPCAVDHPYVVEGCADANATTCPCDVTCETFGCANFSGSVQKHNASQIACPDGVCNRTLCCDGLQLGFGACLSANGSALSSFVSSSPTSLAQCAESCSDRSACVGFTYEDAVNRCKLHQQLTLNTSASATGVSCFARHARFSANWPVVDTQGGYVEQGTDCPDALHSKSRYVYLAGGIAGATTVKNESPVASCAECASACAESADCNGYQCLANSANTSFVCKQVDFPLPGTMERDQYICALKESEYETTEAPSCATLYERRVGFVPQHPDAGLLHYRTATSCDQCGERCATLGALCGWYQCSDSLRICTLYGNATVAPDIGIGDVLLCARKATDQCIMRDGTMLHSEDCRCANDGTTICHRHTERCNVTMVTMAGAAMESGDCLPLRDCDICARVGCPEVLAPVCADNGQTYVNRCAAECVHHEVRWLGSCDNSTNVTHCNETNVDDQIVCGSDRRSYLTECFALATPNVTVLHPGPCGEFCTSPSEEDQIGYISVEHSLDASALQVTVTCADGYIPSDAPLAVPCSREGDPYKLEGCVNATLPQCPCAPRTTCKDYNCPFGATHKPNAEQIVCPNATCTNSLCCDGSKVGPGACTSHTGSALPAFEQLTLITLSHCGEYCAHHAVCAGFTYENATATCHLHSQFPIQAGSGDGACFVRHSRFLARWPVAEPENDDFYLGCFVSNGNGESVGSTEHCHQHCVLNDTFSMSGSNCRCHDYNESETLASLSDTSCPVCETVPKRYCGGPSSMALYDVLQVEEGSDCPDSGHSKSRYVYIRGGAGGVTATSEEWVESCVACATSCAESPACNGYQCLPHASGSTCMQLDYPVPANMEGKQYMCVPKHEEYGEPKTCLDQYDAVAGFVVQDVEAGLLESHRNTSCSQCGVLCTAQASCGLYQCLDSVRVCSLYRHARNVRDIGLMDILLCMKFPTAKCRVQDGTMLHADSCLCGNDGATVCRGDERCHVSTSVIEGRTLEAGRCHHVRECELCTTVGCPNVRSHVCANNQTYANRCKATCVGHTARLGSCDNAIQSSHCTETEEDSMVICGSDGNSYLSACFALATPGVVVAHSGSCSQSCTIGETECTCASANSTSFCHQSYCAHDATLTCVPACNMSRPLQTDCFCPTANGTLCTRESYCSGAGTGNCVPSLCSSIPSIQGNFSQRVCAHEPSPNRCLLSYSDAHTANAGAPASCSDLCIADGLACTMAWRGTACAKGDQVACVFSDSNLRDVVCQCSAQNPQLLAHGFKDLGSWDLRLRGIRLSP